VLRRIGPGANEQENLRQLCEGAKQAGNDLILVVSLIDCVDDYHGLFWSARENGQKFGRVTGGDLGAYVRKQLVSCMHRDIDYALGWQCGRVRHCRPCRTQDFPAIGRVG
jgi:hypothetical protein